MIKYYDTEADYKAAAISESSASLVGATGSVHFDGKNVVVGIKSAVTGSIAVLDGDNALHFISVDTYNASTFPSDWTVVGVVAVGVDSEFFRGKIVLLNKENQAYAWSKIYSWALTGYTLDGTDRTGVLSIRSADDSYAADHDYTVSYNASTLADFVSQLNAFFTDTANPVFQTQGWVAKVNDAGDGVDLIVDSWTYQMSAYNKGTDGFTLTPNLLPGIAYTNRGTRLDGSRNRGLWIFNYQKAVAYLKDDLDSSSYNPSSVLTGTVLTYPVCLPAYLGTSSHRSGDMCAVLRAKFGEGEEGWHNLIRHFFPIWPTPCGIIGDTGTYGDGYTNTYIMAGRTYTAQGGTEKAACPAADYCAGISYSHSLLGAGKWHLPDAGTLFTIVNGLRYGVDETGASTSRDADALNAGLNAIGGTAVPNNQNLWSASRSGANSALIADGGRGFVSGGSVCSAYRALPLLLLDVSEANS